MPTDDGPARVLRYRFALTDKKRGRVSRHLEFAYLMRGVSPRVTIVAELENTLRGGLEWLLPPVDRSRFDLDFEIRETMRRIGNLVNESPSIDHQPRRAGAWARFAGVRELRGRGARRLRSIVGRARPSLGLGPGSPHRTVFILLDEDTIVGLRMDIGGRLYDRLEAFWADVCGRCWLWREAR